MAKSKKKSCSARSKVGPGLGSSLGDGFEGFSVGVSASAALETRQVSSFLSPGSMLMADKECSEDEEGHFEEDLVDYSTSKDDLPEDLYDTSLVPNLTRVVGNTSPIKGEATCSKVSQPNRRKGNQQRSSPVEGKVPTDHVKAGAVHGELVLHGELFHIMQKEDVHCTRGRIFNPIQAKLEATNGNWQLVKKKRGKSHNQTLIEASHIHKVKEHAEAGPDERTGKGNLLVDTSKGDTSAGERKLHVGRAQMSGTLADNDVY
ncbi:hypothetical protein OIU79_028242 [Salix purpurea]|uniref:Uncharacterized protein n=1 Tax=Salix purpurea TaxID=77065 RepID=A0A9Q1A2F1_SALPP|nr:hypothetical protein OIU79_028242 [Salix purpurea]